MAGTLRITGGALVRQRFNVPKEADQNRVRPASDRVREAIFSALGSRVQGARVLDLFAGSGAYGFESISRGAESVLLIEKSRTTAACIRENIKKLKLESVCKIMEGDVLREIPPNPPLLKGGKTPPFEKGGSGGIFDLIFVDPPYSLQLPESFWQNLPNGLVIFRCKSQKDFICPQGYLIEREKTYGGTWVAFLSKE